MKVLLLSALMLTSCGSIEPIDWYEENFSKEYPPLKKEEPIDSLKLMTVELSIKRTYLVYLN